MGEWEGVILFCWGRGQEILKENLNCISAVYKLFSE